MPAARKKKAVAEVAQSAIAQRFIERDGEFGDNSRAFRVTAPISRSGLTSALFDGRTDAFGSGIVVEGDPYTATAQPIIVWVVSFSSTPPSDDDILAAIEQSAHGAKPALTPPELLAGVELVNSPTPTPEEG